MMLRPFDVARDGETLRAWQAEPETARWFGAPGDRAPTPDAAVATTSATRWMLEQDGAPLGYGELRDAADGSHAFMARLVVDPARRRQGLGAALVAALVEQARSRQPDAPIYARVDPHNLPALLAYPSAGLVALDPLPEGLDERWVWLAALSDEPEVPGGPIEDDLPAEE